MLLIIENKSLPCSNLANNIGKPKTFNAIYWYINYNLKSI